MFDNKNRGTELICNPMVLKVLIKALKKYIFIHLARNTIQQQFNITLDLSGFLAKSRSIGLIFFSMPAGLYS